MSGVQKYNTKSRKAKKITNSLIEMIAKDVRPFSILKDRGFVSFVNELNDKYELPNENTLTSEYLPELYKIKCKEIKEKLSNVKTAHFAIDTWKDINRGLYFRAVTAHFCIDGTLQRNTLHVSYFSTRVEVKPIQETVALVVRDLKKDLEVKTIVSNCEDAVEGTSWKHILCFGHALNLAVGEAIKISEIAIIVIHGCRKIVEDLQTSNPQIGEDFPEILSLKMGASGRWCSTYLMLKRMMELEDTLSPIFDPNKIIWNMIPEVISVLEPLYSEIEEMPSNHYVTTSEIIPIVHRIEDKLKNLLELQPGVKLLRDNLLNQLDKYYEKIANNLIYTFATLLDPHYKDTMFRSEGSVELIKQTLEKTSEYSSRSFTDELNEYLKSKVFIQSDPITWWNEKGKGRFPELVKPALEYLCIPALAAPKEHLFSNMGQVILDRRIQLQPKYVNMLAVLGWK